MNRRFIIGAAAVLLLFVLFSAPVLGQTSGTPSISLNHEYRINNLGFGIINETITFQNNGTASEQIPPIQLGIPNSVSAHSAGFVVQPSSQYSMTSSDINGNTILTITPSSSSSSSSLAAGASSTVFVESYLSGILNLSSSLKTPVNSILLLSPSLNLPVSSFKQSIVLPSSTSVTPVPTGFNTSSSSSVPTYTFSSKNITPKISTQNVIFNETESAPFYPLKVFSVVRTIIPSISGPPQVEDQVTVQNVGSSTITTIPLTLLGDASSVTILPSGSTPLINPTAVTLTNGSLDLSAAPFTAGIAGGDNFTFTMLYNLPGSLVSTSGTDVSVTLPNGPPLDAVVQTFTSKLSTASGTVPVGASNVQTSNASPVTPGKVTLTYRMVPGWAANDAVPLAALIFAVAFLVLAVNRTELSPKAKGTSEEGGEGTTTKLSDLTKALEDKIALARRVVEEDMRDKKPGAVNRGDFIKIRGELDSLKSRAMHRLNETKQTAESQRYIDLLNQVQDAEREEDRAIKDLLNLYEQYQSRKMREDTFERLLPSYRRRLDAATNQLSDLLHMTQREGTRS